MRYKPALYFFDVLCAFFDLDTFRFIVYLNTAKINTVHVPYHFLPLIEENLHAFSGKEDKGIYQWVQTV